jgi:hypothetical protein
VGFSTDHRINPPIVVKSVPTKEANMSNEDARVLSDREEMHDPEESGTDILVQDYSDIEITMLKPTPKNFLTWRGLF